MRLQQLVLIGVLALAFGCAPTSGPPAGPNDYVLSVPGMH